MSETYKSNRDEHWTFKHRITGAYYNENYKEPSVLRPLFTGTIDDCTLFDSKTAAIDFYNGLLSDSKTGNLKSPIQNLTAEFVLNSTIVKVIVDTTFKEEEA